MLAHADTYSKAFNKEAYQKLLDGKIPQKDLWKYSSFGIKILMEWHIKQC